MIQTNYHFSMKYNLLQKKHDMITKFFEEGLIDKNTYFVYEKIIEQSKELYTIYLN